MDIGECGHYGANVQWFVEEVYKSATGNATVQSRRMEEEIAQGKLLRNWSATTKHVQVQ
jgi:hypothetical protein